ncbi:MAG: Hsp20/alpha crystallin family protein [Gammaproteobacteria bacterium]|nr:Hsp20/alpha crystallin family protein [Gammaproteobacteria bacterium]
MHLIQILSRPTKPWCSPWTCRALISQVSVQLEKDVLTVEGYIDLKWYEQMKPLYSEYSLGHYSRSFALSNKVDQEGIEAAMKDGVLTLTLPKAKEAVSRQISVN